MKSESLPLSKTRILLRTKKHFSMKSRKPCVLLWILRMEEICTIKFCSTKNSKYSFRSGRSGTVSFRWQEGCKRCMKRRYCIETWKVPMFLWSLMESSNLEIWTFLNRRRKTGCCSRRQAPRITQAPKFGKINPTILKVTSGLLAVCCTKW